MKIGIGNDHAAVAMKNEIMEYLKELGHEAVNYGTDSNESCTGPYTVKKWQGQLQRRKLTLES